MAKKRVHWEDIKSHLHDLAGEMAWGIKHVPYKREEQSLDSQSPHEKPGRCGGQPVIQAHSSTEGIPRASWLVRQLVVPFTILLRRLCDKAPALGMGGYSPSFYPSLCCFWIKIIYTAVFLLLLFS